MKEERAEVQIGEPRSARYELQAKIRRRVIESLPSPRSTHRCCSYDVPRSVRVRFISRHGSIRVEYVFVLDPDSWQLSRLTSIVRLSYVIVLFVKPCLNKVQHCYSTRCDYSSFSLNSSLGLSLVPRRYAPNNLHFTLSWTKYMHCFGSLKKYTLINGGES